MNNSVSLISQTYLRSPSSNSSSLNSSSSCTMNRDQLNKILFRVVIYGFVSWVFLMSIVYTFTPSHNIRRLNEFERTTSIVGGFLVLVSLLEKIAQLLLSGGGHKMKDTFFGSAVVSCSLVVQFIAMMTDFTMAFFPVPIVIDPVTNVQVYLPRWCEWSAAVFIMGFLTEIVDVDLQSTQMLHNIASDTNQPGNNSTNTSSKTYNNMGWKNIQPAWFLATALHISTVLGGLVLPFIPNLTWWVITITFSVALYFTLFVRLYAKRKRFYNTHRGNTAKDAEEYDRARLSYRLMATCTIAWTALVLLYFFAWLSPRLVERMHKDSLTCHFLQNPSLPFLYDTIMDVISKVLYMTVILEIHHVLLDEGSLATRRLEELRRMMSVVWECSSDIICISVKGPGDGKVTTMLSPIFFKFEGIPKETCFADGWAHEQKDQHQQGGSSGASWKALVIEQNTTNFDMAGQGDDHNDKQQQQEECSPNEIFCVDICTGDKMHMDRSSQLYTSPALSSMCNLVAKAWANKNKSKEHESLMMHSVRKRHLDSDVECEVKLTRVDDALILVIRDISERYRRFEAEKKVISETTSREKDAEANRFTRHEVKNGLLAAIGLCDTLKENINTAKKAKEDNNLLPSSESASSSTTASCQPPSVPDKMENDSIGGPYQRFDISRSIAELDLTLYEVLDTVLAEAMARDVVHEVYAPKMERVDLKSILSCRHTLENRFPIVTVPNPLPIFIFDQQLLRYIHRNAISNACKYGKKGGVVMTEVTYSSKTKKLQIDVINLPGENHDQLLSLDRDIAQNAVFAPGTRLHFDIVSAVDDEKTQTQDMVHLLSSGDGAWISGKCAKTFGGDCSIRFETERTVFSLNCSATAFESPRKLRGGDSNHSSTEENYSTFRLPEGTWGIAIDDSKIQRKLMGRFFTMIGVPTTLQMLLGSNDDEILNFTDTFLYVIGNNPNNYFLLIADENLDMGHETISGSKCVEKIRQQLEPDAESKMLALVRSANDSASDVAIYKSRTHGFFPKEPIKKNKVLEVLAPMWLKRFPNSLVMDTEPSSPVNNGAVGSSNMASFEDILASSTADLMQTLDMIDALCFQNTSHLSKRWPIICEKMILLKGDLKTLQQNILVSDVLEAIDRLCEPKVPDDFLVRWKAVRSKAEIIISCKHY